MNDLSSKLTDRDQFIALMAGLGLPPPKKLDLAVPANRACGAIA